MLIDTVDKLEGVMPELLACFDPVVDTETTGLNPWGTKSREPDRVIGIAVDTGRNSYYFPYRHDIGANLPMKTMEFFRMYLSNPRRVYGGFNYKFDQHMLWQDGVMYVPNIEDAMLAVHLLNENEPDFKLKNLGDKYLGDKSSLEEHLLKEKISERTGIHVADKKIKGYMRVLTPEEVEPYACQDVVLTRGLLDLCRPALKEWGLYDLWKETCYYSYITANMENRGLLIDTELIGKYYEESSRHFNEAMDKLETLAGYRLNPNSSKQVCALLGINSSAAEILDVLSEREDDLGRMAESVRVCRGWASVGSRYYVPYLNMCDSQDVLRTSLNLIGTISGRLSSSEPNLQAVAKKTDVFRVKDVFIARPGYTIISADYAQAEMRMACFYAKEEKMADLIRNGADIHSSTSQELGIPRDAAKRINFGVIYGIGAPSLSEQLRIEKSVASEYLRKYHEMYPNFRKLYRACESYGDENGYIRMWTGRVRRYDANNPTHRAMSNLIQGGVAEMMRVAISRLFPMVSDLNGHMLLQVHDQILFEIPDEMVKVAIPMIHEVMEDFPFDPRMRVDISYGKSWGSLKEEGQEDGDSH